MHGAGVTETSKHFGGSVARFSSDILAIFRLKHPRKSDLGDGLAHGGPVNFACDIGTGSLHLSQGQGNVQVSNCATTTEVQANLEDHAASL